MMDGLHNIGACKAQKIVIPLQIAYMILEPVAAEIGLLQLIRLEHRSHGAIEDEDSFFHYLLYILHIKKAGAYPAFNLFSTIL